MSAKALPFTGSRFRLLGMAAFAPVLALVLLTGSGPVAPSRASGLLLAQSGPPHAGSALQRSDLHYLPHAPEVTQTPAPRAGGGKAGGQVTGSATEQARTPVPPSCAPSDTDETCPTNRLAAVAGVAPNDVWAGGGLANQQLPLLEHWNGSVWSIVPGTSCCPLLSIAVVSASDVWAVGGYIQHWDGARWSIVPGYEPPSTDYIKLSSIAAASANDVWAVGIEWTTEPYPCRYFCWHTLVEHWDGSSWSRVPSPGGGLGPPECALCSVAVVSASDVWATGAVTLHWDGSSWALVPTPGYSADHMLLSISGRSANDVWAVGHDYRNGNSVTLAEHWDGTQWSVLSSPSPQGVFNILYSVSAMSPEDVWAVGVSGSSALIEHWDGTQWSIVPNPGQETENSYLSSVDAIAGDDVWAVGGTLIEHWDGSSWGLVSGPNVWSTEFSDVPPGSSFYDWVGCLACKRVISGYADGTFRPNDPVTRGQLAKIVSNAAGYAESFTTATFVDVPVGSAFHEYVGRLASRGYVSGYACGGEGEPCPGIYFRPGSNVTRSQTSKIVALAAGLPVPPRGAQTFEDMPPKGPESTFWPWVEALAATGAIGGYPCGGEGEPCNPPNNRPYFRPNANVSRGQSAKIVSNTFFPNCSAPAMRK